MRAVLATFNRELRAYFLSPLAYVVLFFFLVINGITFSFIVAILNDPLSITGRPLDFFFGETFFFWLVLIFVGPILTMRLLAEERKSGSVEVLMTAPISETQVVVGKYLASLAFYFFLWLPTVAYALIVGAHSKVDWGPVVGGYLGIVGIGAVFLAVGAFASSLTKNQIIAAIIAFAFLIVIFMVPFLEGLSQETGIQQTLSYLNLVEHMSELKRGIVDTRRLVYYSSMVVFFLFLTSRALANNKWR